MIRGSALGLGLLLAASAAPAAEGVLARPWPESGPELSFGAAALSVFNGSPLSYTPLELGWRFSNGLRLRGGVDIFYYEGRDTDAKNQSIGVALYSYDMMDLRGSLLYAVPLPGRIRPLAGMTLELLRGERKLAGPGVLNPPKLEAWGFLGTGAVLGAEWRFSEHWSAELQGRYTFSYSELGAMTAVGLNAVYLY